MRRIVIPALAASALALGVGLGTAVGHRDKPTSHTHRLTIQAEAARPSNEVEEPARPAAPSRPHRSPRRHGRGSTTRNHPRWIRVQTATTPSIGMIRYTSQPPGDSGSTVCERG